MAAAFRMRVADLQSCKNARNANDFIQRTALGSAVNAGMPTGTISEIDDAEASVADVLPDSAIRSEISRAEQQSDQRNDHCHMNANHEGEHARMIGGASENQRKAHPALKPDHAGESDDDNGENAGDENPLPGSHALRLMNAGILVRRRPAPRNEKPAVFAINCGDGGTARKVQSVSATSNHRIPETG